jgi:hypothetical protein
MQLGTAVFHAYAQTLRRVYWAEFIEDQIKVARSAQFRANLVGNPYGEQKANLLPQFDYFRHRAGPTSGG